MGRFTCWLVLFVWHRVALGHSASQDSAPTLHTQSTRGRRILFHVKRQVPPRSTTETALWSWWGEMVREKMNSWAHGETKEKGLCWRIKDSKRMKGRECRSKKEKSDSGKKMERIKNKRQKGGESSVWVSAHSSNTHDLYTAIPSLPAELSFLIHFS